MNRKLGAALGVVVALVAAWLIFFRHHGDTPVTRAKPAPKPPSLATQHVASAQPPKPSAWELDLDREGPLRLEGQVIDADGHGVGGAEVWLGSVPPRTAKTEDDGSFSFDKLVGRAYRLTARHASDVGGPIVYKLTDTSDPAILQLAGSARLVVTVADDQKHPIAGATVAVDEDHGVTAETAADGTATVAPVHPGWIGVHASAKGYAPNSGFTSVGSAGATGHLELVLHTGVAVSGHVIDETGKPIARARVSTAGMWNLGSSVEPVTTDEHGAFALVLGAGTHTLSAIDAEHAPARSTPIAISTKPVDNVEIVMKAGGRIAGHVVDAKHQPIAFATVRIAGKGTDIYTVPRRQTTTATDGAFELRGLARAKLEVRAESDTGASKIVTIDLTAAREKADVELVLDVTGTIAGIVVDDKGQPVPEVQVGSVPDVFGGADGDAFALAGFSSTTTDGAGAFTIHGLPDGPYKLHASRHDASASQWRDDGVSAKTGDVSVKITLAAPGSLKGTIVKTTGGPPAIAMVRVGYRAGTPASAGAFVVDELEPGKYDVTIHGPEFADVTKRDVVVEAGKATDLGTLTVARGRSLVGRVVDGSGTPVSGAKIKVGRILFQFQGAEDQMDSFDDASNTRTAYSDQDGNFTVIGIPKLRTNVMAEQPDRGRSDALEIGDGEDDPPEITLKLRGFGTITGKVTMKGAPATGVAITDTPKTGGAQLQIVQADDTGGFTITKVAEGPHTVSAMQQGGMGASFKSTSTAVTVVAGQTATITLDIPVGAVTLAVSVKPAAGATVNAAQIFLMNGAVQMANAKELTTAFLGGGVVGMKFWFGTTAAEFDQLVPGLYSACSVPITGNMSDGTFLQRLQEHQDVLKVYCAQVHLAASPERQTITQELPTMAALPVGQKP